VEKSNKTGPVYLVQYLTHTYV